MIGGPPRVWLTIKRAQGWLAAWRLATQQRVAFLLERFISSTHYMALLHTRCVADELRAGAWETWLWLSRSFSQ